MAVYKSGLEVDHEGLLNGEFDIVFECKPQRWLTSGESASAVANNGTLSNPTLFESSPLLAVKGYGGIHFNGFDVEIENVTLGDIILVDGGSFDTSETFTFDKTLFNNGDSISVSGQFVAGCWGALLPFLSDSDFSDSNVLFTTQKRPPAGEHQKFATAFTLPLVAGTNKTETNTLSISYTASYGGISITQTWTITQTIQYNASAGTITMSLSGTATTSDNQYPVAVEYLQGESISILGNSTISALGNPTYIDCDLGECYMLKNGNIVSLNGVIDLGSDLPVLASGSNAFTYDNTITELKVAPRWWQV